MIDGEVKEMMNDTVQPQYSLEEIENITQVSFPIMKEIYLTGITDPRIIAMRLFRGRQTLSLEKGLKVAMRLVTLLEDSGIVVDGKLNDYMYDATQEQVLMSCSDEIN